MIRLYGVHLHSSLLSGSCRQRLGVWESVTVPLTGSWCGKSLVVSVVVVVVASDHSLL